jgi:hypothetical protein
MPFFTAGFYCSVVKTSTGIQTDKNRASLQVSTCNSAKTFGLYLPRNLGLLHSLSLWEVKEIGGNNNSITVLANFNAQKNIVPTPSRRSYILITPSTELI